MRDDVLDKAIQTTLIVYPHLIRRSEEGKLHVRCNVGIQTETHIDTQLSFSEAEDLLIYTPFTDICRDAVRISDIPKKYVLKFKESVVEESIGHLDEISQFENSIQLDGSLVASPSGLQVFKSNLKQKMVENPEENDMGVQTDIMVRPYILHLDEVATVYCDMKVQTSQTFSPNASMSLVTDRLNKYQSHYKQSTHSHHYHQHPDEDEVLIEGEVIRTEDLGSRSSEDGNQMPIVQSHGKPSHLTSKEIGHICQSCCTEEQVLGKVHDWYRNTKAMIENNSDDEKDVLGKDVTAIEAEIRAAMDSTVYHLESQLSRMKRKFDPENSKAEMVNPEESDVDDSKTHDVEIQNTEEFADHLSGHNLCKGGKFRDKSCTCDCQLVEGVSEIKEAALRRVRVTEGNQAAHIGRSSTSSPALVSCQCRQSADLPNEAPPQLPINARACTTRKCNCFHSEGCRHCDQALKLKSKMDNPARLKSCKKYNTSQNVEFLTEFDNEYADSYLELLEQDEAGTQTEATDLFFGMPNAPAIPEPPCSCLTNVEMPWDLLLIPPTPKKRPPPEEAIMEAIPEEIRNQLKELTVRPMSDEQLAEILHEFLKDNIANADTMEEIEKQVLAEKARLDAEAARLMAEEEAAAEEEEQPEEEKQEEIRCRPRPAPKPFQVFEPECEVYNEPYMDRMYRFICDEENDVGECTSRIEMPWHQIELPKNVRIRKGKHPCESKPRPTWKDPSRVCGPEYRESLKRRRELLDNFKPGIISCLLPNNLRVSEPNLNTCVCPSTCLSRGDIPLQKGVSDTCVCAPGSNKAVQQMDKEVKDKWIGISQSQCKSSTEQKAPCQSKSSSVSRTQRIAALLESCKREMEPIKDGINQLRARIKELNLPDMCGYQEAPQHLGAANSSYNNYLSGCGLGTMGASMGAGMGASMGATMGPSMGATMGPSMGATMGAGMSSTLGGNMMGTDMYGMSMCYPPAMMCYPYPPCMYPSASVAGPTTSTHKSRPGTSTRPRTSSRRPRKSRTRCGKQYQSSSYNTTTDSGTTSTDFDRRRRRCGRRRSSTYSLSRNRRSCVCSSKRRRPSKNTLSTDLSTSKASSVKLICACGTSVSIPPSQPSVPTCKPKETSSKSSMYPCVSPGSKRSKRSRIPRPISQMSSRKSGLVCPCSSLATQRRSGSRTPSSKRSRSCKGSKSSLKSCKSSKSSLKGCKSSEKPASTSSVAFVRSCSTQFVNHSSPGGVKITIRRKPSGERSQALSSSCSTVSECKNRTGPSSKYKPMFSCAGVEVKNGRPVDSNPDLKSHMKKGCAHI